MSQPYDVPFAFDDDPFVSDSYLRYNEVPKWGDLIDPELIHDYVYEGDDE